MVAIKLNLAYPTTGQQKVVVLEDEKKLRSLYDKRISNEVSGEDIGEEFAGYVFKITGGTDRDGFPMRQGVLASTRVRLLLSQGSTGYRVAPCGVRKGKDIRKRKSVRGCIVGPDLATLSMIVVKKGDTEIEGFTDVAIPKRLGPKRANKIRKLFSLTKADDIRKYVISRTFEKKRGEKTISITKRPKIQRLVTPVSLHRKHQRAKEQLLSLQQSKKDAAAYTALVQKRLVEQKAARKSEISKRRSSRRASSKLEVTQA